MNRVLPLVVLLRKSIMNNIREYVLCRDDIFYFMMNYLDLEFIGFQIDMITKFLNLETGKIQNIMGHRGCGLTTVSCIYVLWKALFYPCSRIAFNSPRNMMAQDIKNIFYILYEMVCQKWNTSQTKYIIEKSSERYIKFDNQSYIHFTYNKEQLRGNRFDTIIYDSPYIVPETFEVFNLTIPCGYNYVILNTCLSPDEHELEKVGTLTTYPWYCNPNLTQNWYLTMLNSLGNADFLLKYGCTRGT